MDMRETTDHRNRNDDTFLVTKRTQPSLWQRFLDAMSPDERTQVEARVKAAEQRESKR